MMMWRPRLPSPFGTTFLGAPTALQLILHDLGFAPVQSDGEILVACCLEWVKNDKVANPDAVVFDPRPWTRIVGLAPDGNHVLVASRPSGTAKSGSFPDRLRPRMSWQWPTSGGIGKQGRSKPNCRHLRERWNNT